MRSRNSRRTHFTFAGRIVYDRKKHEFHPQDTARVLSKTSGITWDPYIKNSRQRQIDYTIALANELIFRVGELININEAANELFFIVRQIVSEFLGYAARLSLDLIQFGLMKIEDNQY